MTYVKLLLLIVYTLICSVFAMLFSIVDRSFYLYFKLSKVFSRGILFISRIKLNITGIENIDSDGCYVFVSNHASQFDIMTLQAAVPVWTSIFFKKELGNIPIFGWQLVLGPYFSIDRKNPERAHKTIMRAKQIMLDKNISVLLFAEGTRSKDGSIQPFKRGAFNLAAKVEQPVVPVTIKGSARILPKGSFKLNSGVISVHFDKPIPVKGISTKAQEIELMQKVHSIVSANYERMN